MCETEVIISGVEIKRFSCSFDGFCNGFFLSGGHFCNFPPNFNLIFLHKFFRLIWGYRDYKFLDQKINENLSNFPITIPNQSTSKYESDLWAKLYASPKQLWNIFQLFHFNPETPQKNQIYSIVSSTSDKNRISTLKESTIKKKLSHAK